MTNQIIIDNIQVDNLEPLKNKFINKNNKFSAKGYYKDIKVKVFETFDQNQGDLLAFVSNDKHLSTYFPKLLAYDNNYIIEEWLEGITLKELNKKNLKNIPESNQVKKIIKLMWTTKYDKEVFDYIDYIHKRVSEKNNFDLNNVPIRINHNDLSLDNILATSDGLKIIDNEFLGCNRGWILNFKNSFIAEDFDYKNFVSEETLNKLWEVRKKWSTIVYKDEPTKSGGLLEMCKKILAYLKFTQRKL